MQRIYWAVYDNKKEKRERIKQEPRWKQDDDSFVFTYKHALNYALKEPPFWQQLSDIEGGQRLHLSGSSHSDYRL